MKETKEKGSEKMNEIDYDWAVNELDCALKVWSCEKKLNIFTEKGFRDFKKAVGIILERYEDDYWSERKQKGIGNKKEMITK